MSDVDMADAVEGAQTNVEPEEDFVQEKQRIRVVRTGNSVQQIFYNKITDWKYSSLAQQIRQRRSSSKKKITRSAMRCDGSS